MTRILITGSRHGWDADDLGHALERLRAEYPGATLVHGAARGVDIQAATVWRSWGLPTEAHPALWAAHGKGAGPIRNQEMVDAGAEICVAFLVPGSRGTADCLTRARTAGIPTRIYEPRPS